MWTNQETLRLRELQTVLKTVDEIASDLNKTQLDVTNKLMSLGYKPIHKKPEPDQTSFLMSKAVEIPQTKKRKKSLMSKAVEIPQTKKAEEKFDEQGGRNTSDEKAEEKNADYSRY